MYYKEAYLNKGVRLLKLLGIALKCLSKYDDANQCFDLAIQIDSSFVLAYYWKGFSYYNNPGIVYC